VNNDNVHDVRGNWTVDVSIDEHEGQTRATARLQWRDQQVVGVGTARLNPADRYVAEIGDELAVARALSDAAIQMMAVTAHDIESATHEPVTSLHWRTAQPPAGVQQ
jgi:uncharacterized protein DUF1876